jgi:hypothetical protein
MSDNETLTARNAFDTWLTDQNLTSYAASRKLADLGFNLSVERIRQLRFPCDDSRFSLPSWPTMQAVYHLTDGAIGPSDWADPVKFPNIHLQENTWNKKNS